MSENKELMGTSDNKEMCKEVEISNLEEIRMEKEITGMKNPSIEPGTVGTGKEPEISAANVEGKTKNSTVKENPTEECSKKNPTEECLKEKFGIFEPATLLYAIFYAFCMFQNKSGITFPFFMAGTLFFFCFTMAKLERTLKEGSVFYMVAMGLLAVSTFCTDDSRIIFFNKLGIFLLMMSLLLKQFYNTDKWGLGKYFDSIVRVVVTTVWFIERPVKDAKGYLKAHGAQKNKNIYYALLGVGLAVPLMLVVLALLSTADALFRQVTDSILRFINLDNVIGVVLQIVFMFLFTYLIIANLCSKNLKEEVKDHRNGEPVLAITIASMLTFVYLFFSGIQIFGLFLGQISLPEGYTYASYAREGFFQLLAVSALNLVMVLFFLAYFKESKVLKVVLTTMSFCTFVMIASSALRMVMYIRYFYLTFLRILVLWALLLLFLLFVGVVISIFRKDFKLFQYGVTVVSVLYLALSFSHPDLIIAKVNLSQAPQTMEEALLVKGMGDRKVKEGDFFQSTRPYKDYRYIADLSMDAAPVVVSYLETLGYWNDGASMDAMRAPLIRDREGYGKGAADTFGLYYLQKIMNCKEEAGIRNFNLSRFIAVRQLN